MNILITSVPMINDFAKTKAILRQHNLNYYIPPNLKQVLTENELIQLIPNYDIWIVGDDPVTEPILKTGQKLRLIIKWGIGTDNVNINACRKYNIQFTNTPAMFGEEVSDVAIGYMIMLSRELHTIHYENIYNSNWYKPQGFSLKNKKVAVIGYGNIGQALVRKLKAFMMDIAIYDPYYENSVATLKDAVYNIDYLFITCPLTNETHHMITTNILYLMNENSFLINVSRGQIVKESDVIELLENKYLRGFASDVFEEEPLVSNHQLKKYNCIFGSHNASNTKEAVDRTNQKVLEHILDYIGSK